MIFLGTVSALLVVAPVLAQGVPTGPLPLEPLHQTGQSVTGAFEGWFALPDGQFSILVGYFNRNSNQSLDIPIGPDNRIEPDGPDYGQPTHFLPGRQWGVFTIRVPRDFGKRRLTWTLTVNGRRTVIPLHLDPLWIVSPYRDASANTPPYVSLLPAALGQHGPPLEIAGELSTSIGQPLPLIAFVGDDARVALGAAAPPRAPAVQLRWSKFRGPGEVRFTASRPPVEPAARPAAATVKFSGVAATSAEFTQPGDYLLTATATDWSGEGGGGFQCCWTTVRVKVTVK